MKSEKELLNLTFETLMCWAAEEADANFDDFNLRYSETVYTYLEELERTLKGASPC